MTAAQYKAKYDNAKSKSLAASGTALDPFDTMPEKRASWAQIGGVWAFLWMNKQQMEDHGITPSATNADYVTKAEANLAKAEAKAPDRNTSPQATSWAIVAQNDAYIWLELTRRDNPNVLARATTRSKK